jgi:hypothetical protein
LLQRAVNAEIPAQSHSIGDYASAAVGAEVYIEYNMWALPDEQICGQKQDQAQEKAGEARRQSEPPLRWRNRWRRWLINRYRMI